MSFHKNIALYLMSFINLENFSPKISDGTIWG
jgi:hypothetical protein